MWDSHGLGTSHGHVIDLVLALVNHELVLHHLLRLVGLSNELRVSELLTLWDAKEGSGILGKDHSTVLWVHGLAVLVGMLLLHWDSLLVLLGNILEWAHLVHVSFVRIILVLLNS